MKRSRITFLLGIVSLVLSMTSIIFALIMDIRFFMVLFLGVSLFCSILLIIPATIGAYFEKYARKGFRHRGGAPIGRSGSTSYGITFLASGLFGGYILFGWVPPEHRLTSPILGIIVLILYILIGLLGIVAAIVYHDDKIKPSKPT